MRATRAMKVFLLILGTLSAVGIAGQLVMGQLILSNRAEYPALLKAHQHSGYLTVAVSLTYIALSLVTIASMRNRDRV
jgi:hypothetical protein